PNLLVLLAQAQQLLGYFPQTTTPELQVLKPLPFDLLPGRQAPLLMAILAAHAHLMTSLAPPLLMVHRSPLLSPPFGLLHVFSVFATAKPSNQTWLQAGRHR